MLQTNFMDWSPSMMKRHNVFMRIQTKYTTEVTCYVKCNYNSLKKELCLGVYKMATEEVQLLVKAAKKFYKLVEV